MQKRLRLAGYCEQGCLTLGNKEVWALMPNHKGVYEHHHWEPASQKEVSRLKKLFKSLKLKKVSSDYIY